MSVPVVLVIVTLDTKADEAAYLKRRIELHGCKALIMDAGILGGNNFGGDIVRTEVAKAGGWVLEELVNQETHVRIGTMIKGCAVLCAELYKKGAFQGVISIGGAQGTDIGTAGMRELPFGVPKFMVSTVASGRAIFGPYVGTKDVIMMHSVADIQGINFLTRTVFDNAVASVCGMLTKPPEEVNPDERPPVALSMLGSTTAGAMRAHQILMDKGYNAIAFHQNGTGGIAMEDLIRENRFKAVLDINLHEIGDAVAGGLHGAIKDYRLTSAAETGIPQVIAPGSINYAVWGPEPSLSPKLRSQKYVIHNPQLTLVRITNDELVKTAEITAERISRSKGPVHVYIPLKGLSYYDQEGGGHWDPEANELFFKVLKKNLDSRIPYDELDMHINSPEFIDVVTEEFIRMLEK